MLYLRPILFATGSLLAALAAAMLFPAVADLAAGHENWRTFALAAGLTAFMGGVLVFAFRAPGWGISAHQTFVLTSASWVVLTAFAALPFHLSDPGLTYAGAYFEAMSGLTTTGSTVLAGLEHRPPGILLWRAILQWLGGIGIIVMAVAILPFLGVGGMQLFRTESSDRSDKALPRTAQIAARIGLVYTAATILWAVLLWLAGMGRFDAVCHAMTTIATGGYSTRDASVGGFGSPLIETIIIFGMILGSLPFMLYFTALRRGAGVLFRDMQVRWFLAAAASAVLLMTWWRAAQSEAPAWEALREAAFNTTSVMTGTGYTTADYDMWGGPAVTALLMLMFVGGCTGGTTGAIKIFRFQVLFSIMRVEIARIAHPRGVFIAHYNHRPITDPVAGAVLAFFFMFLAAFSVVALALALHGYDFITSISGAATAIANVGPGLGHTIGPNGNFSSLADSAKWILSAAMLLGRLEFFTVLVLFLPRFWKP